MFGQILDLILFPIKEFLKLLVDDRITDYLGFSVMAGIVTCVITLIVIKALVNTTYVGEGTNSIHMSHVRSEAREARKVQRDVERRRFNYIRSKFDEFF